MSCFRESTDQMHGITFFSYICTFLESEITLILVVESNPYIAACVRFFPLFSSIPIWIISLWFWNVADGATLKNTCKWSVPCMSFTIQMEEQQSRQILIPCMDVVLLQNKQLANMYIINKMMHELSLVKIRFRPSKSTRTWVDKSFFCGMAVSLSSHLTLSYE